MKRIINFRTFLYTAVNAVIGSFISVLLHASIFLGIISFFVLIVVNILLAVYYRKYAKYVAAFSVSACLLAIMLIIAGISCSYTPIDIDYGKEHVVTGSVYSVAYNRDECVAVIENVRVDGIETDGKIKIFVDTKSPDKLEFLREDHMILFSAEISKIDFFADGFVNKYATSGIRYISYPTSSSIEYIPQKASPLNHLRSKLKMLLIDFMGDKYGNIAYGILSGNRSGLDFSTQNYFSASGLGHVLAVSGLHIGFLSAALMLCMKKVSPKIKVPIVVFVTILYSVFAGFSASVIRAVIMSSVVLVTAINGQRSDLLNNLSLAFSLIIAFSPFSLFDAGFLMSFCAVFGIACFSNTFRRLLKKIRFPNFLASSIAVSAAAQLGITPCLLFFFHNLPLYSVIANIIMMPLITITFVVLFLVSILCLIINSGVLLVLPQSLLILLDGGAHFISNLPFSQITVYVSALIFLSVPLYFVISRYFMLPKFKWLANIGAVLCCTLICIFSVITSDLNYAVIPISAYNDVSSVVCIDDKVLLVGDCTNSKKIMRVMENKYLGRIDGIYLTSMSEETAQSVIYLSERFDCGAIYCPYFENGEGLTTFVDNDIEVNIFDATDNLPVIKSEYYESKFVGYSIDIKQNKKMLFVGSRTDYSKINPILLNDTAVLRCGVFTGYLSDRIFLTNFSLPEIDESGKYVYSVKSGEEFIFNYMTGELYK